MKTAKNLIKRALLPTLLLYGIFAFNPVKAQVPLPIPYPITNSLSCDVDIAFTIYDNNCVVLCNVPSQTIPAGQTINIPICLTGYDIEFTINWIDVSGCVPTLSNGPVNTGLCNSGNTFSQINATCGSCRSGNFSASNAGATIW